MHLLIFRVCLFNSWQFGFCSRFALSVGTNKFTNFLKPSSDVNLESCRPTTIMRQFFDSCIRPGESVWVMIFYLSKQTEVGAPSFGSHPVTDTACVFVFHARISL